MDALMTILVSVIAGGLSGAISILFLSPMRERQKVWVLSDGLRVQKDNLDSATHYRFRVHNPGSETIFDATGYVTLNNKPSDIVAGPPAYQLPGHPSGVQDERLCWAIAGNPHRIDIFPGERQILDFAQIVDHKDSPKLVIASESGFGDDEGKRARVSLTPRRYEGTLKIVGRNVLAREFSIEIVVREAQDVPDVKRRFEFGLSHEPEQRAFVRRWPFVLCNQSTGTGMSD